MSEPLDVTPDDDIPMIPLDELGRIPRERALKYLEGIWRKCTLCNPYIPEDDCGACAGQGVYLLIQPSDRVIGANRLETDVPEGWRIGDSL